MKKLLLLVVIAFLSNSWLSIAKADESPLFVTITAGEACFTCKKFEPILKELEDEYDGRIAFITLDVSSKNSLEEARQIAEKNGLGKFFDENRGMVPRVGILCPKATKTDKIFTGEVRKEIYEEAINEILLDTSKICSL